MKLEFIDVALDHFDDAASDLVAAVDTWQQSFQAQSPEAEAVLDALRAYARRTREILEVAIMDAKEDREAARRNAGQPAESSGEFLVTGQVHCLAPVMPPPSRMHLKFDDNDFLPG